MQITPYGAAGEVTGSAYLVQTDRAQVLIDFGMFQGVRMAERRNTLPRGISPRSLDAVLLTHCHLDHVGRLPLLARRGYEGPVFATPATQDLTALILRDSAKIQAHDAERLNRKLERQAKPPEEPLYTIGHVEAILGRIVPVAYDEPVDVAPGIKARFAEAGHILGSSSIQLLVQENGHERIVVFSGDLGPLGVPILKDYECLRRADMVFLESTYGDRDHRSLTETVGEFEQIVARAVEEKGKILVPTFAVGRAQLMLYLLASMFRRNLVPRFPIYLDSPMAIEATRIYERHPELYDEEAISLRRNHQMQSDLSSLNLSTSADDSKAINEVAGPCLVLAGAGMCNAGRILHHLKQNLWRPETWVLIVGYQGEGSLGRRLVEGEPMVRIHGEKIAVQANIRTLGGFSAHAGQKDLLHWFACLASGGPRLVLTHGEGRGREGLREAVRERFGIEAELPGYGEPLTLD
ncbi:MAG: MBL fold metallo-hydrolase [Verrucomicrobiales bacterium]|nr:MBL fold metallo-hydrolase [Verrucomicrobiales bacterium]MCP5526983.1 MBL fold metallo-hydrolase [Verrucomicrobiales bacterium]